MMKYLLIFVASLTVYGQDIETILEHNPFDPNRGKVEEEQVEEAPEAEVSAQLPILDGTVFLGETRIAMFTVTEEGQPVSARVRVNEEVGGYKVVSIERLSVKLSGNGQELNIAMYSDRKENRGGTKQLAQPAQRPTLPTPEEIRREVTSAREQKKGDDKTKQFRRRNPPARPKIKVSKKTQELKNRF